MFTLHRHLSGYAICFLLITSSLVERPLLVECGIAIVCGALRKSIPFDGFARHCRFGVALNIVLLSGERVAHSSAIKAVSHLS